MPQLNDLSRSLAILEQDATLIAVIEMGQSSWLVAGIVPGIERSPLKKLAVDESALLKLLHRWREEAEQAGHRIKRIAVAFEAGRDGFWLARWLRARGIEPHVIHASSVAVSREHRRAKTDRLASNISRRHLTKGQQAMAVAMVYPVPEKGGKGKRSRIQEGLDEPRKTFQNRLSQARIVFAYSPDLAQAVLAGSKFLDAAYDEAKKAKQPLNAKVGAKTRRAANTRRGMTMSEPEVGNGTGGIQGRV